MWNSNKKSKVICRRFSYFRYYYHYQSQIKVPLHIRWKISAICRIKFNSKLIKPNSQSNSQEIKKNIPLIYKNVYSKSEKVARAK